MSGNKKSYGERYQSLMNDLKSEILDLLQGNSISAANLCIDDCGRVPSDTNYVECEEEYDEELNYSRQYEGISYDMWGRIVCSYVWGIELVEDGKDFRLLGSVFEGEFNDDDDFEICKDFHTLIWVLNRLKRYVSIVCESGDMGGE